MARLLLVFLIGLLLAGCDTDVVKFNESFHKFNKVADNARKAGDYEYSMELLQQLAAKGYAPGLSVSIFMYRSGHFPKNSKLIEANMVRLNELGYVDAKEQLAYLYGAGSGCPRS